MLLFGIFKDTFAIEVPESNYVVTCGKDIVIECRFMGSQPVNYITWQKSVGDSSEQKIVPDSDNFRYMWSDSGSSLKIVNAEEKHSGTYSCFATIVHNQQIVQSRNIDLFVRKVGEYIYTNIRSYTCYKLK